MKVNDLSNVIRGIDPRETQRTERNAQRPKEAATANDDGDALDLSPSAKISTASRTTDEVSSLSSARIAEIQGRISSGFYSQSSALDTTADRLLNFYSR
jgi:anti-sigma28 factor (negative regulator of flagellin synthesis)